VEAKARISSQVLDFIHRNKWEDSDDFILRLVDRLLTLVVNDKLTSSQLFNIIKSIKTNFFVSNHLTKSDFTLKLVIGPGRYLNEIGVSTNFGLLTFEELFDETKAVPVGEGKRLVVLLDIGERIIQDAIRDSLREKEATNISERKRDTPLEIADLEHFALKIRGEPRSFACVVKGYRSIPHHHQTVTWEDVSHQITKAYQGTFPDYVLLVLAKNPVDSLITNLVNYSESIGNPNLIVMCDPVNLARFLHARKVI